MAEIDQYDDPVEASKALDQKILAIPKDRVFTKRAVMSGFLFIVLLLSVVLGRIDKLATDTNDAVTQEIPGLKKQIEQRDEAISDYEDVLKQATDWIVKLIGILTENGIEPPLIEIRPQD